MQRFREIGKNNYNALQIYLILISRAMNRQTITYKDLAETVGFGGAGVLGKPLDPLMKWCDRNGLPPLTALVVQTDAGVPGSGLTTSSDLAADQQAVFKYDWFSIMPPSPEELA